MTERIEWTDGSGRLHLALTLEDAKCGSHQGQCDADVADLRSIPYIAEQLDAMPAELVRDHLREYGTWDAAELADHEQNLHRVLWLACGDIREEASR